MEASHTHTPARHIDLNVQASAWPAWLVKLEKQAEFSRYAIISVAFLLIGIVGGITVGFFIHAQIWQLALVTGTTMLSLTLMLAVAPMRYILITTAGALMIDLLLMIASIV